MYYLPLKNVLISKPFLFQTLLKKSKELLLILAITEKGVSNPDIDIGVAVGKLHRCRVKVSQEVLIFVLRRKLKTLGLVKRSRVLKSCPVIRPCCLDISNIHRSTEQYGQDKQHESTVFD